MMNVKNTFAFGRMGNAAGAILDGRLQLIDIPTEETTNRVGLIEDGKLENIKLND